MTNVFMNAVQFSIQAGFLVLALVIIRLILKKAPRFIICALWALVAIRLIVPFQIESIFSVAPATETLKIVTEEQGYAVSQHPDLQTTIIDAPVSGTPVFVATSSVSVYQIASYIWIAGIVVMLMYAVISYLRLRRMTRESVEAEKGVCLCDRIPSPFILGVIRPKIFLPSDISEHDKPYVLAHERAHIKRRDHLWKPLGFLLLSVYWFNPLLWVAYVLLCRDIEMACDEKVIRELGFEIKKPYAIALINAAAPRRMITACPLAFGETGVKTRIKNILNYKKPAFWVIAITVVLSIAVAVCFLTNPVKKMAADVENTTVEPTSEASVSPTEILLEKLEPYEAVNAFFQANSDKFPESRDGWGWGNIKQLYYGGTYLEGAWQVIMLTDVSEIDDYVPVGREIRYEKCDYTYKELTDAIQSAGAYLGRDEGYGKDFIGMALADEKNRIFVSIYDINDEKINWFKETVSDKDYFVFRNTYSLPQDLDSLTVKADLPTITYADDQYIYLDGDCGIVIFDYANRYIVSQIPVSRLRKLGYTVPYSHASADGKRITIRNYTGEPYVISPFMEYDPTTGKITAMSSGELSAVSDQSFIFDYQDYDIKYDENGKNISERIYRKGDTEYRLSAPGWMIKNTTVTVKDLKNDTEKTYRIFE